MAQLLPVTSTIKSDILCQQIKHLNSALKDKRTNLINCKCIVFHHDTAKKKKTQLKTLFEKKIILLSPYLSDFDLYVLLLILGLKESSLWTSFKNIRWKVLSPFSFSPNKKNKTVSRCL